MMKLLYQFLRLKLAKMKARYYDYKFGIETEGMLPVREDRSLYKDMVNYQPTFYGRLEKIIKYLHLTKQDVFMDLGCGKGRAVFFVALQRLKLVIGVELDEQLFEIAQSNLKNLKINKSSIKLINSDAAQLDVSQTTIFFMFNPFGQATLEKIIDNIRASLSVNPRKIRIVYYAPAYRSLLDTQNWLVFEGQIENDTCLVWRNR